MSDRHLLQILLFHGYFKEYCVSFFSNVLGFHLFTIVIKENTIRRKVTPYFSTKSLQMCQTDTVNWTTSNAYISVNSQPIFVKFWILHLMINPNKLYDIPNLNHLKSP